MKVFISSVVTGFESFREAAAKGARALGHEILRSEDFAAAPDTPRRACLAAVREADAVLVILGARYGEVQQNGLSATHEEYRTARERCPVFVFVLDGALFEPRQLELVKAAQAWDSGQYTAQFRNADELRDLVTLALHRWQLRQSSGTTDVAELRARASRLIPTPQSYSGSRIVVAVVGGPPQTVLRPAELEDREFRLEIQKSAIYGASPVLDSFGSTKATIRNDALVFEQDENSLSVSPDGSIVITSPARAPEARSFALPVLIEEDVREVISRSLTFTSDLLDRIDPDHRLTDLMPVVYCRSAAYMGWRTRAEHAARPNSMTLATTGAEGVPIELSPPVIKRGALRQDVERLADDFTVLLRRRMKA